MSKKNRRRKEKLRQQRRARGVCVRCESDKLRQAWQRFKNGTWHLRLECGDCGKYQRYLPQTETEKAARGV